MRIFPIPAYNKSVITIPDSVRSGDREIPFTITYSRKRKTVAIIIHQTQSVEVRAPAGVSRAAILEVVLKKSPWILKKLDVFDGSDPPPFTRSYVAGESFLLLGKVLILKIIRDDRGHSFIGYDGVLTVSVSRDIPNEKLPDHVREKIVTLYRNRSVQIIGDKVRYFSAI